MSDINYDELFGVDTATADVGENEQAVAEPAETEEVIGVEEQEPAEPAEEQPKEQSREDNAKFAAARRAAEKERDEAIAKAKTDAQEQFNAMIKDLGLTNPYTNKPITSKAEYEEYKAALDNENRERMMRDSGMSEDEFNDFVSRIPEVQDAKRIKEEAEQEKRKLALDEQIRVISEIDPSIKTVDDLLKQDNFQDIYDKVNRGYTVSDAYKLINYDKITAKAVSGAKQAALNNAASKNHLTATTSRGAGGVEVPPDVKEMYRMFNPGITEAEMSAHYASHHNN